MRTPIKANTISRPVMEFQVDSSEFSIESHLVDSQPYRPKLLQIMSIYYEYVESLVGDYRRVPHVSILHAGVLTFVSPATNPFRFFVPSTYSNSSGHSRAA
jgi:hypothetical protein